MSPPMMMVPRAYSYTAEKKSRGSSPKSWNEGDGSAKLRLKKEDKKSKSAAAKETPAARDVGKPKRLMSITHSTPSQPVVIPTRTSTPKQPRKDQPAVQEQDRQHDSTALSPSMAALLAITHIPRSRARAIKKSTRDRLSPSDWRQSVSSTSPRSWSILQSPPDASDVEVEQDKDAHFDIEVGSIASRSTLDLDRVNILRSLSSDSIPSLDEQDMFNSPESPPMPRTPSGRRGRSPRREKGKMLSTSEPLADGETHPLAMSEILEQDEAQSADGLKSPRPEASLLVSREHSPAPSGTSQFRSNLTASLQRLKTAARSITIPTPSVSTVLAINSRVLPEIVDPLPPVRPLPMTNSAFSKNVSRNLKSEESTERPSASELYFSSTPSEEYRAISSIQLQAYMRQDPNDDPLLDKATAPPIFLSSDPAPPILLPGVDHPRPREPRENSDFLRVIVLEMNMRRNGKLGNVAGRAKIWLGPRAEKAGAVTEPAEEVKAEKPSKTTRAERGMGEAVASELAEAMMVDGEEATMVRSLDKNDDDSGSFDADVHERAISRTKQTTSKGSMPARWQPVSFKQ